MPTKRFNRRRALQCLVSAPFAPCATGWISRSNYFSEPSASEVLGIPTTAKLGPVVSIPYPLYGFNSGANLAHYIADASFMKVFGSLGPSILRYPGGNSANWFDLNTGLLFQNPNPPPPSGQLKNFTIAPAFTFSALAKLLTQAKAQATIVLNLLTGNMHSQIHDLKRASKLVAIQKIELGNEYYLNGVHGDQYTQVFPLVQDFARRANSYAAAIKAVIPSAELGVTVYTYGKGTQRESLWNSTLVPLLSKDINALIPHNYQNPPDPPFSRSSLEADTRALEEPGGVAAIFSRVRIGTDDIKKIAETWPAYKIWNTETNLRDRVGAIAGTWTHGLYVAYQLLALLGIPNIAQALVHAVTNGTEFSAIWSSSGMFPDSSTRYARNSLSASGISLQLVFAAARTKSSARQLSFSTNPDQTGANGLSAPSLYGWVFGPRVSSVLLNLSATAYALRFSEGGLFLGATYTQLSGKPTAYIGTPTGLASLHGSFDAESGLTLPPYSITLLGS